MIIQNNYFEFIKRNAEINSKKMRNFCKIKKVAILLHGSGY